MARARNIKPGFFMNDKLAEIDPLGRLLYAGLWTIADREGRLEDRPKKIKAEILPYDNCDVNLLLDALNDADFICRYTVDGQNYIQILKFLTHQNPHPKEAASVIPVILCKVTEKQLTSNLLASDESITKNADPLIPLILISDSPIPITSTPSPDGDAINKPRSPFKSKAQEHSFDQFWAKYPKRKARGNAEKIWVKINPDELLFKKIINGIENGRASPDWKKEAGEFIPYPASWLNAKGWEDEYSDKQPTQKIKSLYKTNQDGLSPAAILNGGGNKFYDG
jgi:hypothetical protein